MSRDQYSVLVVDDSAMMRNLVGRIVDADPRTRLAGKAANGRLALQKIERLQPDVILLDIEMPEMNGIEFLRERRRRGIDTPVIVLSSLATRGARITMEALALGASDFVLKPSGSESPDIRLVADEIVELAVSLAAVHRARHGDVPASREPADARTDAASTSAAATCAAGSPVVPAGARATSVRPAAGPIELVAIGVSTGGPNALRKVFALIPGDIDCSIVVVQHMPAGFTTEFAAGLDRVSALRVREAADGERLEPGTAYIAPGDYHLTVERRRTYGEIRLGREAPRNGHRPSADMLFASVARAYGDRAIGVIMTGMGKDGATELGSIMKAGGITLAQDEQSSVVYGMPRVAGEMGHVMREVQLAALAETITDLVKESRRR